VKPVEKPDRAAVYQRYLANLERGIVGDDAWVLAEEDEMAAWLAAFIESQPVSNGGKA